MTKKRLLAGFTIILLGFLVGSIALAYSSPYSEKHEVLLDTSFKIEGGEHDKFRAYYLSAPAEEIVISYSVSKGIIKFTVFPAIIFENSLGYFDYYNETTGEEEKIQVWLFEGSHGDVRLGGDLEENQVSYIQFCNPDSYEKEVDLKVTKTWYEPINPLWMMGVAIMTVGTGIGLHIDKMNKKGTVRSQRVTNISKKLFVGYAIPTFIMTSMGACAVSWSINTINLASVWRWSSSDMIYHLILPMPLFLLLVALPLSAFLYLLLKKGGGLSRLRGWNMGRWSRIPASLLLSGYVLASIPFPIAFLSNWSFFYSYSYAGFALLYFNTFYVGSAMMLCGLVALFCLWIKHLMNFTAKIPTVTGETGLSAEKPFDPNYSGCPEG